MSATQGNQDNITLCHASPPDQFIYQGNEPLTRDPASIVKGNDQTPKGHDSHPADIIPAFDYATWEGDPYNGHYPGKNLDKLSWIANGCKAPSAVVVNTTVFDASTDKALTGQETAGASVYDTATVVAPSALPVPTGTVTYIFYTSGNCVAANALGAAHITVTLSAGKVPNSMTEGPLFAGSYSFKANYSGDAHYLAGTSACEPFTINETPPPKKPVVMTTTVFDASTDKALTGEETAGASVYDTAMVVPPSAVPVPTGTVTYIFYTSGNCVAANALGADHITVTLSAGKVPNSMTEGPLSAGNYSFKANYSGDSHYLAATSACEPFGMAEGSAPNTPAITTSPNPTHTSVGATLKDTATLNNGVNPTGKITFSLKNPSNVVVFTVDVTVNGNGNYSTPTGFVSNASGVWHWQAAYSGDGNNNPVSSNYADEPVTVDPAGGVLAQTAMTLPGQSLALGLLAIGVLAMLSGFALRRREA